MDEFSWIWKYFKISDICPASTHLLEHRFPPAAFTVTFFPEFKGVSIRHFNPLLRSLLTLRHGANSIKAVIPWGNTSKCADVALNRAVQVLLRATSSNQSKRSISKIDLWIRDHGFGITPLRVIGFVGIRSERRALCIFHRQIFFGVWNGIL